MVRHSVATFFALTLLLAGCGGGHHHSTPIITTPIDPLTTLSAMSESGLSPGNTAGQDEDPSILRALDGKLYVAWYSNRNPRQADGYQDKELFLMRSSDGSTWTSPPIQLTRSARYSFYASLVQDVRGTFHLAWARVNFTPDGCVPLNNCTGSTTAVMYKTSANGIDWNLDQETTVLAGPGDMLPCLVYDKRADRLLIFFSSPIRDASGNASFSEVVQRLYVVTNNGTGWSAPQRLQNVNMGSTHNIYPQVMQREDGQFLMTWMRYTSSDPNPARAVDPVLALQNTTSDILWATSVDGLVWTSPTVVSDGGANNAIDILPSLYLNTARSEWRIFWQTARNAQSAATGVEMRVGGSFPADLVSRPELTGYSGHILATATPSIYWGVSVTGVPDTQKISHVYFRVP